MQINSERKHHRRGVQKRPSIGTYRINTFAKPIGPKGRIASESAFNAADGSDANSEDSLLAPQRSFVK
jgi:hypothetical protein